MRLSTRIAIAGALIGLGVIGWWRLTAYYDNRGYQRAWVEAAAALQAQQERNRELQRAAEKRYIVQAGVREEYFVETVKEIEYVTNNLASCELQPAAIKLLNAAAECASDDRPSACGYDDRVRNAPPTR